MADPWGNPTFDDFVGMMTNYQKAGAYRASKELSAEQLKVARMNTKQASIQASYNNINKAFDDAEALHTTAKGGYSKDGHLQMLKAHDHFQNGFELSDIDLDKGIMTATDLEGNATTESVPSVDTLRTMRSQMRNPNGSGPSEQFIHESLRGAAYAKNVNVDLKAQAEVFEDEGGNQILRFFQINPHNHQKDEVWHDLSADSALLGDKGRKDAVKRGFKTLANKQTQADIDYKKKVTATTGRKIHSVTDLDKMTEFDDSTVPSPIASHIRSYIVSRASAEGITKEKQDVLIQAFHNIKPKLTNSSLKGSPKNLKDAEILLAAELRELTKTTVKPKPKPKKGGVKEPPAKKPKPTGRGITDLEVSMYSDAPVFGTHLPAKKPKPTGRGITDLEASMYSDAPVFDTELSKKLTPKQEAIKKAAKKVKIWKD